MTLTILQITPPWMLDWVLNVPLKFKYFKTPRTETVISTKTILQPHPQCIFCYKRKTKKRNSNFLKIILGSRLAIFNNQ